MRLSEFWEATETETSAMAIAWSEAKKAEHHSRSWFTAHLIAAAGNFKRAPSMKRLLDDLNAPYADGSRKFTIASKEEAREYEQRFGVALLPEEDDGRPE